MATILGSCIAYWSIYALLALAFKHKFASIISIILFLGTGITQLSLRGDFSSIIAGIITLIFIFTIIPLQVKSEKKKAWKENQRQKKQEKNNIK